MNTSNQIDLSTVPHNGVNSTDDVRGTCPHCGINLENGIGMHEPSEGYKHDEREFMCLGCGGEYGPLLRKRKGVSHEGKKGARNEVSIKQWLKSHAAAHQGRVSRAEAYAYAASTGRSETTVKIQAKAAGITLV